MFVGWCRNMDLAIEATRAQECRVERFRNVRCTYCQHRLGLDAPVIQTNDTQDLLKPACLDVWRIHLHQQLVETTGATHTSKDTATHCHGTSTACCPRHADGVDFIHEDHTAAI